VAPTHEPFDREDRVFGIGHGLTLRHLADQPFTALGERDDRRRESAAFGVGDDHRLATFHDGDNRIGGAQVDTNDFAHVSHVLVARRRTRCVTYGRRTRLRAERFGEVSP
jgi:hypothetical protein